MPKFKHKRNGNIIEVSEEHAQQVIRRKRVYEEIEDKPQCPSNDVKETESQGGSGDAEESVTPAPTRSSGRKSRGRPPKRTNSVGAS